MRGGSTTIMRNASRGSLSAVRLTEFWHRMDEQFGVAYAQSVARDYVLAGLGGRTITQALADGELITVDTTAPVDVGELAFEVRARLGVCARSSGGYLPPPGAPAS